MPAMASVSVTVQVSTDKLGLLIGKQGTMLKSIETAFSVKMAVPSKEVTEGTATVGVALTGTAANVTAAKSRIFEIVAGGDGTGSTGGSSSGRGGNRGRGRGDSNNGRGGREQDASASSGPQATTASVRVPCTAVGLVVGKGGSTIKEISSTFGVKVIVPSKEEQTGPTCQIKLEGTAGSNLAGAKAAIKKLVQPEKADTDGPSGPEAASPAAAAAASSGPQATTASVRVPCTAVGLVVGKGGSTIKEISSTFGVKVIVPSKEEQTGPTCQIKLEGTAGSNLAGAKAAIKKLVQPEKADADGPSPSPGVTSTPTLEPPPHAQPQPIPIAVAAPPMAFAVPQLPRQAFLFVDNSNIIASSQNTGGTVDKSKRLDIMRFVRLMEDERVHKYPMHVVKRFVVGSFPGPESSFWDSYKQFHYHVHVQAPDKHGHEQAVDDVLHSMALKEMMEYNDACNFDGKHGGLLILATGDGNANAGLNNFPSIVERAAKRGWLVHNWSWSHSRSRMLARMADLYPEAVQLFNLDDYVDTHQLYLKK